MLRKYLPKNPDIDTLKAVEHYMAVLNVAILDDEFFKTLTAEEQSHLKALKNHNLKQLKMIREIIRDLEMKAKEV